MTTDSARAGKAVTITKETEARAIACLVKSGRERIGGDAANADWVNARRAVKSLLDGGLVILDRDAYDQLLDAYVMQAIR